MRVRDALKHRNKRWKYRTLLVPLIGVAVVLIVMGILATEERFPGAHFNEAELDRHIMYLSSDRLSGRGVGTKGEQLSANYIRREMERIGFDTVIQEVPLEGVRVLNAELVIGGQKLQRGRDFVMTTELSGNLVNLTDERLLFGGHCIKTDGDPVPYDNFCSDLDVRDALVVCLVNDPFEGPLTYYGRWIYKVEELRRRGAKGVLLVHTDESAGYGWNVIRAPDGGENLKPETISEGSPLFVRAWISEQAASALFGKDIADLVVDATSDGFCVADMNITASVAMTVQARQVVGSNVIGVLNGTSPDYVVLMAHHDHLGAKTSRSGTIIYPGALDNASGVAKLLLLGKFFSELKAKRKCCQRKFVLVVPTAEEAVLLGSAYFATNPLFPLSQCTAAINMDGMNVWGETRDAVGIGAERSTLGDILARAAQAEGQRLAGDPTPEQGLFFRSDQLSFARRGVPAIKVTHGFNYVEHGQDMGDYLNKTVWDYNRRIYHQPTDTYEYIHSLENPYTGAWQELKVASRVLFDLLERGLVPKWMPGEPFAHARAESS